MGVEYHFVVPEESRAKVADVLAAQLRPILARLDPRASDSFPNVFVEAIPEGLYICDNLSDAVVAALVIRSFTDLLLAHAPEVRIVDL